MCNPTDGADEVVEECVGEQRFGQLPEVHLQSSGGHMDVLPLPVLQVHLLIWTRTETAVRAPQTDTQKELQEVAPVVQLCVCVCC